MSGREIRFVSENQRVLAVDVFGIEIRGVTEWEHPIDEWEGGPQLWPGADYDQFAVRVVILDGLSHSRRCDVLS